MDLVDQEKAEQYICIYVHFPLLWWLWSCANFIYIVRLIVIVCKKSLYNERVTIGVGGKWVVDGWFSQAKRMV